MRIPTLIPGLLLCAAACAESPVLLPHASGVQVSVPTMSLVVGDQAPVGAQVIDESGRAMQGKVVAFSTDNPSVATVTTDGMVRAVAPGTANVSAAHGASTATVKVTVVPDRRGEVQTLEVTIDSVVVDTRAGARMVAVRAINGLGAVVCPQISLISSAPLVATVRMAGICTIEVMPIFVGETTITAAVDGHSDAFRVRVTSTGAVAFFSGRPTSAQLVAGETVSYTVKVLDAVNRPLANQRVNFAVSVGTLASATGITNPEGAVTVRWALPTDLRPWGQTHSIEFRAPLANGTVASQMETVFIDGASLHHIALYRLVDGAFTPLDTTTIIRIPTYVLLTLGAAGLDQYGNVRVTEFRFAVPTSPYIGPACGGSEGIRHVSGIRYTCFYNTNSLSYTVTVTAFGGLTKSVQVTTP